MSDNTATDATDELTAEQDTFAEDRDSIRRVARTLRTLASAFCTTGNDVMADRLQVTAGDLDDAVTRIAAHETRVARERFVDTQQASANLYRGVMAGIDYGRKSASAEAWRKEPPTAEEVRAAVNAYGHARWWLSQVGSPTRSVPVRFVFGADSSLWYFRDGDFAEPVEMTLTSPDDRWWGPIAPPLGPTE